LPTCGDDDGDDDDDDNNNRVSLFARSSSNLGGVCVSRRAK
jgi:hypothetical protein